MSLIDLKKFNQILRLHISFKKHINIRPFLPIMLEIINPNGKGFRNIYKIIHQKSENIVTELTSKWEKVLNEYISIEEVTSAFLITHKTPNCVYNRCIQFQILHNRLNT